MKYEYLLNQTNYYDFNMIEDNTISPRSYFIPYSDKNSLMKEELINERYNSSLVTLLNGEWDFKYYKNPNDCPSIIDIDLIDFDKINVPSCYQLYGYGLKMYLNARYPFPCKPPYIPTLDKVQKCLTFWWPGMGQKVISFTKPIDEYNSIAIYHNKFNLKKEDGIKNIISFLGVANSFDLYINSKYVGYSEGSHNTHEFDITEYLNSDNSLNDILVVLHRFSNGSYLECQDMFRFNGIFRDVLLRKERFLKDYSYKTKKNKYGYELLIDIDLYKDSKALIEIPSLNISYTTESINNKVNYLCDIDKVTEWNSEKPYTYELYISLYDDLGNTEVIRKYIGFKTVKIENDKFYLNDKLLKIRGVNHHDTNPYKGYYMDRYDILKDIKLIKEYNCNTIRTSHYPSDPLLIDLANIYGLYIIDEADIETHGVIQSHMPPNWKLISNNKKWLNHYLNRIKHLYNRDKNNVSIIMWSLGNESGGDYNFDRSYEYLKEVTDLPIHYESCVHTKRIAYDVVSEMYTDHHKLELIGKKEYKKHKEYLDKPFFLCEYSHAMGVGPGGLNEYLDIFYKYDNLIGGCIWEFCDHAIYNKDNTYEYGGDNNEYMHDSNFCCDGLFYPDRTPSTGAHLMKHAYRPLIFKYLNNKSFEVFNTYQFTNSNEYKIEYIYNDKTYDLSLNIEPFTKSIITIDNIELNKDKDNFITFNVYKDNNLIESDFVIINEYIKPNTSFDSLKDVNSLRIEFNNGYLDLNNGFTYSFNNEVLKNDRDYTILYRAEMDNDRLKIEKNRVRYYTDQKISNESYEIDNNIITKKYKISTTLGDFNITDKYEVSTSGDIKITSRLEKIRGKLDIYRFAKAFYLNDSFDDITYYGRKNESYCDMKDYSPISIYNTKVLDMTEPNLKPQESGNRCDTRFASLKNDKVSFEFIALDNAFELGIKPYSDYDLGFMKHKSDELRDGTHVLINMFNRGSGTAICGPGPLDKYLYKDKVYEYSFIIKAKMNE